MSLNEFLGDSGEHTLVVVVVRMLIVPSCSPGFLGGRNGFPSYRSCVHTCPVRDRLLTLIPASGRADGDGYRSNLGGRGRDDFSSSRRTFSRILPRFAPLTPHTVDRGPPREDLPLPTEPPYTAFVGNLAFDLTEIDLEEFFAGHQVCTIVCFPTLCNPDYPRQTKSVKIIKDREEKPKGFGYIEFADLEGLKDALSKSGTVSHSVNAFRTRTEALEAIGRQRCSDQRR